jgi:single-strand DNA-binding protein
MASFNKVILIGNLTRDVELRYLGNGTAVSDVSLAVNESYKNKEGQKVDNTVFVECTLWGKTAELAGQYLAKGKPVMFEGKLKLDQWDDKETGKKRSKLGVTVESMQFLGAPSGGKDAPQEEERPRQQQTRQSAPAKQNSHYDNQSAGGDDVPF